MSIIIPVVPFGAAGIQRNGWVLPAALEKPVTQPASFIPYAWLSNPSMTPRSRICGLDATPSVAPGVHRKARNRLSARSETPLTWPAEFTLVPTVRPPPKVPRS